MAQNVQSIILIDSGDHALVTASLTERLLSSTNRCSREDFSGREPRIG